MRYTKMRRSTDLHSCGEVAVCKLRRRIVHVEQPHCDVGRTRQSWNATINSDDLQMIDGQLQQMTSLSDNYTRSSHKYVCITTCQPDIKFNPITLILLLNITQ